MLNSHTSKPITDARLFSKNNKQWLMLLVYLVVPMSGLGLDLYAPSLPSIMHDMQAPRNLVQLSLTAYILAFAIGQPLIGPITDTYGRKKVMLSGLTLHMCITLLIPFLANIHSLVGL